jgi:hypothetical protein
VTWYLSVFAVRMLAVEHATSIVQIVKFPDAQACDKARVETTSDGIATVCTSSLEDANGFIAAMGCRDSHLITLPNGSVVARFNCTPDIAIPK